MWPIFDGRADDLVVGIAASGSDADQKACSELLRHGSRTFFFASRLLPPRLRSDVAAVYAFCRVADDAIDLSPAPHGALAALRRRLDAIFAGRPTDDPVDRALHRTILRHTLPRGPLDALLEGFAWDAEKRQYDTIDALLGYCARVASGVGVAMACLMGVRDAAGLSRACDLGLAMQLTNVARDVGEDARAGRLYLPLTWLAREGLSPQELLAHPQHSEALGRVIRRLLARAETYYHRSKRGVARLPWDCRMAISAARVVYAEIGREIARQHYDSVSGRAFTSTPRKLMLLAQASQLAVTAGVFDRDRPGSAIETAPAAQFLVAAATRPWQNHKREPSESPREQHP